MIILKFDPAKTDLDTVKNIGYSIKNMLPKDEEIICIPMDVEMLVDAPITELVNIRDMIDRAIEIKSFMEEN